jgi:hypothetical protein
MYMSTTARSVSTLGETKIVALNSKARDTKVERLVDTDSYDDLWRFGTVFTVIVEVYRQAAVVSTVIPLTRPADDASRAFSAHQTF